MAAAYIDILIHCANKCPPPPNFSKSPPKSWVSGGIAPAFTQTFAEHWGSKFSTPFNPAPICDTQT